MQIDYAVISSDSSDYQKYRDVVTLAWNKLGIKVIHLKIGNKNSESEYLGENIERQIELPLGASSGFIAQVSRLYASFLYPFNLLISDIDMMPINGAYFKDIAGQYEESKLVSYTSNPYYDVPYDAMCYILTSHRHNFKMSDLMNGKEKDFTSFCYFIFKKYGGKWNSDENFFYDCYNGYENKVSLKRDLTKRLARGSWFPKDELFKDFYIDSHLPRPFDANEKEILKVYEKIHS